MTFPHPAHPSLSYTEERLWRLLQTEYLPNRALLHSIHPSLFSSSNCTSCGAKSPRTAPHVGLRRRPLTPNHNSGAMGNGAELLSPDHATSPQGQSSQGRWEAAAAGRQSRPTGPDMNKLLPLSHTKLPLPLANVQDARFKSYVTIAYMKSLKQRKYFWKNSCSNETLKSVQLKSHFEGHHSFLCMVLINHTQKHVESLAGWDSSECEACFHWHWLKAYQAKHNDAMNAVSSVFSRSKHTGVFEL